MENRPGYYKGNIEMNGFRTPFIVFAKSNHHATEKALKDGGAALKGARVHDVEGPYLTVEM